MALTGKPLEYGTPKFRGETKTKLGEFKNERASKLWFLCKAVHFAVNNTECCKSGCVIAVKCIKEKILVNS